MSSNAHNTFFFTLGVVFSMWNVQRCDHTMQLATLFKNSNPTIGQARNYVFTNMECQIFIAFHCRICVNLLFLATSSSPLSFCFCFFTMNYLILYLAFNNIENSMIWIINFDSIMNWCPIRENKTTKHQIHFCMAYTIGYLYLINPI